MCWYVEAGEEENIRWLETQLNRRFFLWYLSKAWEFIDTWLQALEGSASGWPGHNHPSFMTQCRMNFLMPLAWLLLATESPALLTIVLADTAYQFFRSLYLVGVYEAYGAVVFFTSVERMSKVLPFLFFLYMRVAVHQPCDSEVITEAVMTTMGFLGLFLWWWDLRTPSSWPHKSPETQFCSERLEKELKRWRGHEGEAKETVGQRLEQHLAKTKPSLLERVHEEVQQHVEQNSTAARKSNNKKRRKND